MIFFKAKFTKFKYMIKYLVTKTKSLLSSELTFKDHYHTVIKTFGEEKRDFYTFHLPENLVLELNTLINSLDETSIDDFSKKNPLKISTDFSKEIISKLILNNRYLNLGEDIKKYPALVELLNYCKKILEKELFSPFAFVGVRVWETYPKSSDFGPNAMHKDGFDPGHSKIMVYLNPLNDHFGKLKIEDMIIEQDQPSALWFKNSELNHSGVPGTKNKRRVIEITVMNTLKNISERDYLNFVLPHYHQDRHLLRPELIYENNDNKKYLSIGSGKNVDPKWICLDALLHPGITRFEFNETESFPLESRSIEIAYNSHNLEHLNEEVTKNIVKEVDRVLVKNGKFILKIPDFEKVKHAYINNDIKFFERFNFFDTKSISWSWENYKVEYSLLNITAMMFCGYWNKHYGDHFSNMVHRNEYAYHGPPRLPASEMDKIIRNNSPKNIAKYLSRIALSDKEFLAFNHQNAWSYEELKETVENNSCLKISEKSKKDIQKNYSFIPNINDSMKDWSMYLEFTKN